jgi:hypothetical protein
VLASARSRPWIVLPLLNGSLVPSFKDRDVLVRLDGAPGTSNPRMTRSRGI